MRKKKTRDRNRRVGPVRQVEGSPGCQPRPAGRRQPRWGQVRRLQDVCIQEAGVVRMPLNMVVGALVSGAGMQGA